MKQVTSIVLQALLGLLARIPLRLLRYCGRVVGRWLWFSHSRSRRVTEENLAICFPAMDARKRVELAQQSLQHLGMTALELGPIWGLPIEKLLAKVACVEGESYLQQGLDEGKGVMILAPHIGAWELLGLYLSGHYCVTSLYQPPDNPSVDELILKARMRGNAQLVPTDTRGVKKLLQALKRGELVAILPDQVPPREGADYAPFFGQTALTMTLARNLAQRTGARVLMGYALRIAHTGDFQIIFDPVPEDIAADDTLTALTVMNKKIEDCVRRAPEQYQWEYKRFKKQPEGEKKFYQ
jgi:KDO2-lipid IV(A) lauroyltransferase